MSNESDFAGEKEYVSSPLFFKGIVCSSCSIRIMIELPLLGAALFFKEVSDVDTDNGLLLRSIRAPSYLPLGLMSLHNSLTRFTYLPMILIVEKKASDVARHQEHKHIASSRHPTSAHGTNSTGCCPRRGGDGLLLLHPPHGNN